MKKSERKMEKSNSLRDRLQKFVGHSVTIMHGGFKLVESAKLIKVGEDYVEFDVVSKFGTRTVAEEADLIPFSSITRIYCEK